MHGITTPVLKLLPLESGVLTINPWLACMHYIIFYCSVSDVESMDVTSDSKERRPSLKRCSDCPHNQTSPVRSFHFLSPLV